MSTAPVAAAVGISHETAGRDMAREIVRRGIARSPISGPPPRRSPGAETAQGLSRGSGRGGPDAGGRMFLRRRVGFRHRARDDRGGPDAPPGGRFPLLQHRHQRRRWSALLPWEGDGHSRADRAGGVQLLRGSRRPADAHRHHGQPPFRDRPPGRGTDRGQRTDRRVVELEPMFLPGDTVRDGYAHLCRKRGA
jgi:hypothetical protein